MARRTGRNRNTNTDAVTTSVSLNSSTATTIQAENLNRMFFNVNNNNGTQAFWVRLYPAAQDNTKHGIFVSARTGSTSSWEMPSDNIYTGEISAIADNDSPIAYVTEY